jgi:signal transduction histidine kinase
MGRKMKLATKISLTVVGVLLLGALSSIESLLVAREMGRLLRGMIAENVSSVRAAEELEIALLEQRGLVSSYILDRGNQRWLAELQDKKASFEQWLARAEETAHTRQEHQLLGTLRVVYEEYDGKRDEVITLFENNETDRATAILLNEVNRLYKQAYEVCEGFITANESYIDLRSARARTELRRASIVVGALVALTLGCGVGLLILFFRGVVRPLRQMADDARAFSGEWQPIDASATPQDELRTVGFYLRSLMSDVTETHTDLERSRVQLLSSEKLASLGKLAASIGHEIRNPLTSLEMRLFSIRQAVGDNPDLEDDLRVVSEEIAHLESIVRNFLEFSRPPALNPGTHSVSRLLDKTLELCHHWLEERNITVVRQEERDLPPVKADSEQIKQVFLNLLRNAVEAMDEGGVVHVSVSKGMGRGGHRMAIVRVRDSGSGIPPAVRDRILEPFYSTKPDGTGLGLCIAARIMALHGGRLELEPPGEQGATFAIWIPVAGGDDG